MKLLLLSTSLLLAGVIQAAAQPARIFVNAAVPLHTNSPYLTGACIEDVNHEIYGGLYSQMIFGESFQEPVSIPPLLGFTAYGGSWEPQGQTLLAAGGSGPKLMWDGFNGSNAVVGVELRFADDAGGNAGLVVAVNQARAGADAFTGYEISLAPKGTLVFGRHRQNWEPIKDVPCSVPIGQWINLEVRMTNATLAIFVNGSRVLEYADTQHPLMSGQVGLRTWQQTAQFRNLAINHAPSIPFQAATNGLSGGVSGMWDSISTGTAVGQFSAETTNLFVGSQCQRITFARGAGEIGIANRGLNRWGLSFAGGRSYNGLLDVRADSPGTVWVSLENSNGLASYAEQALAVNGTGWQQLQFNLTPAASDVNGRFAIKLKQPGSVAVGYALLQPGPWGRFQDLPVRKDVAQGLIDQGITVLRYGGSMVNAPGYRWKNMIGARDRRPPYPGTWYAHSSNGWGILDFLDFTEAAGFLGIPDLNVNESAQDISDFVEYVNGPTNTVWGARRAANGHAASYNLKYIELGNEERVDGSYFQKFEALARAIWAKDTNITIVVGDFSYHQVITNAFSFGGADSGITSLAAHQDILRLARQFNREVWFDVHVWTDGPLSDPSLAAMFSFEKALGTIADGARYKVVVFELNANNHSQRRALGNALAINAIQRSGRLPITTSANCLQPDGQNDNGWDQGLLFLDPSHAWLQPPGYVSQMYAAVYQPVEVAASVVGGHLDVSAQRSRDGTSLVLKIVNTNSASETARITLEGFKPSAPVAAVKVLAGPLDGANSAKAPFAIVPSEVNWKHDFVDNAATYAFAPYSVTTIVFQGQSTATMGKPPGPL